MSWFFHNLTYNDVVYIIEKYIRNEANGLLMHIIEWKQFILELVAYLYALIGIETKLDFSSPPKSPTNTDLTLR
jgi:hypothetical protein